MYLKSIAVVGYKSFAEKTHLDLGPGITGIIGPNGCGKSNIMEAVRWCLGEMSWKSLRAGSMLDVIFSGTAKRAPLSMTEVTLTFDNASSLLPVEFSEVTVSRRIFRSGESAYFLNKTQCRLRDIRELFLDTGLGGDGYAIIDQGGVDFVLNSKPEERRSIFEEAAGVAKYKAKREEALRKLERVEMDLGRLQDSVALINQQVRDLDLAARRAKLYQKHKEELAGLETVEIMGQIIQAESELGSLSLEAQPLEEALGSRRAEMAAEGARLSALKLDKAERQGQVMTLGEKIAEIKQELGRIEERLGGFESQAAQRERRGAEAREELSTCEARLSGLGPRIEAAGGAASEAQAAADAAGRELEQRAGKLELLERRRLEAEQALEGLKGRSLKAAQRTLDIRRELSGAESSQAHQQGTLNASLRELERDQAQLESVGRELSAAGALLREREARTAASREEAASAAAALADARERQAGLSRESLRLHADMAQARARSAALDALGGQNPYWAGAQAVLNSGLPGVLGTVRQMMKVEPAYRLCVEDALGERLYAVVCEDSTAARSAVEWLEASGQGRARFLVLSALPSHLPERAYPAEARPLLRHVECQPEHESLVSFLLQESYALGRALFGDHWVCGGAAPQEGAVLSLADIGEAREAVSRLETRGAELESQEQACLSGIAACSESSRDGDEALRREMAEEYAARGGLQERRSALAAAERGLELSRGEAARHLSELALVRESIRGLRAELAAGEAAEASARQEAERGAMELSGLREDLARGEAEGGLLKARLETCQERLAAGVREHERLLQEKGELEGSVLRRREELSELERRREEERRFSEEARERRGVLGSELALLENEAKTVFSRLQEIEKVLSEKEEALRVLRESAQEAQERLHRLAVEASARRGTAEALTKRLWDDWQLTLEEAKARHGGLNPEPGRIESLKKRIAGMGNINMAAPEEYQALSERQAFLSSQINDLNLAKEDLRAAIQKINSATRENFRQTFSEVREHFRRLYGVLFEGGEADLVLTDPENILETGVEIVAQPPGKRLQSISLLSGGEKALTAIALLFAFFMVKPSPFCMLDEADAALDDANIERFVGLLREFQARTQFLIVSHNKRTMEAADVIYGVTMEDLGISQLISVDFRKKGPAAPERPSGAAVEAA